MSERAERRVVTLPEIERGRPAELAGEITDEIAACETDAVGALAGGAR